MNPHDSPEEAAFRAEARAFLDAHARPYDRPPIAPSAIVAEWTPEEEERKLAEARAWQRTKFDNGWAAISWPTEYGGRGGTPIQEMIFRQEEARYDVPQDALVVGIGWCGPAVLVHGTEEQRRRFLPPMLRGDEVWCQLFSEPGAGSDLAGLATRAVRDGDEWVLNGQKIWTTFAHHADWGLCIARHDPDAEKHRGLTAFIVDMRADGVTCRPIRQMTGSANFNEVFLEDVRVPMSQMVGAPGDGWRVVITTFMFERFAVVSPLPVLDALRELIAELGVGDDPLVRDRFAALYARGRALGAAHLRLMTAVSKGRMPGPEGSMMKLSGSLLLSDTFEMAMDLLGATGLVDTDAHRADEWQAAYLGAPGLRIGGGTDQIQRNIIGERVLGLPGEPRVDKGVPFRELARRAAGIDA